MKTWMLVVLAMFGLPGCSSIDSALTPSLSRVVDDYDGKVILIQEPVNCASSQSGDWFMLGFYWAEKYPEYISLLVNVDALANITGLKLKVDGVEIVPKVDNVFTNMKVPTSSPIAKLQQAFTVSYTDFVKIANASEVIMKVEHLNTYNTCSFGKAKPATVNSKFQPFMEQVEKVKRAPAPTGPA